MTKRMLIDASHAEETRVVVLDGNRLEEFDLETAQRKPLKGNIYLAKVVRVEPSLQAAFVEYGGNRHGFLAFGEIHPDYYQIPVADRQRLLEMQAAEAREDEEDDDDPQPESPMDRAEGAAEARWEDDDGGEAGGRPSAVPLAAAQERRLGDAPDAAPQPEAGGDAAPEPASAAAPDADPAAASAEAGTGPGDPAQAEAGPGRAGLDAEGGGTAGAEGGQVAPEAIPSAAASEGEAAGAPEEAGSPLAEDADPSPGMAAEEEAGPAAAAAAARLPNGHAEAAFPSAAAAEDGAADPGGDDALGEDRGLPAHGRRGRPEDRDAAEEAPPEVIGGEGPEEAEVARERRIPPRFLRHYKIQEVIKRRQIMLVQVVKEERGTKGAALTTYISLAGRFSVLMPNSPRGGGVSRKITQVADRKRLREVIDELGLPTGMSLIVRTAGAQRPKPEIKRDCEYLLRLWDNIRERTLASTAPALIYEEADLIKRAIRDVFSRDVEEILVDGDQAYQEAREFMRMLMPQHVKKIQPHREGGLFARQQVEAALDAMHSPSVQLKSGGYIVINQTEALVAIDVNSGRSTRERHIEDTALRTNLEAADEIARQLRLRDLAGLIVIDFIDMESSRHDGMVERRLKEALKHDRARIQVGRISHFGLLEMSRQRLRPSLAETSFVTCPHCAGRGQVRSVESAALQVLRAIEEEGAKRRAAEICVHAASPIALYLLNRKRDRLAQIEARFGMTVLFEPDASLTGAALRIERLRAADPSRPPPANGAAATAGIPAALRMDYAPEAEPDEDEEEDEEVSAAAEEGDDEAEAPRTTAAQAGDAEEAKPEDGGRRRRRRRRRRPGAPRPEGAAAQAGEEETGGEEEGAEGEGEEAAEVPASATAAAAEGGADAAEGRAEAPGDSGAEGRPPPRRRRGRRPGSGPQRPEQGVAAQAGAPSAPASPGPAPAPAPRYVGPTPADPFAGHVDHIFAAMEAAEAAAEAAARRPAARAPAPPPAAEPEEAEPEQQAEAPAAGGPEAVPEAPPVEPAAAAVPAGAPEPGPALATATEAEPAPATLAAAATPPTAEAAMTPEPQQGPAIQPKVIGEAPVEAPRRSGWWRR